MLKKLALTVVVLALVAVSSVSALAQFLTVDCSDLYPGIMPTDCVVDENGHIVLPDGIKVPYTVTGNPVTVQEDDLYPVPEMERDSAGVLQYGTVETVPSGPCEQSPQDIRCRNGFSGT